MKPVPRLVKTVPRLVKTVPRLVKTIPRLVIYRIRLIYSQLRWLLLKIRIPKACLWAFQIVFLGSLKFYRTAIIYISQGKRVLSNGK